MIKDIVKVDVVSEVDAAIKTVDMAFLSDTVSAIEVTDEPSFGAAGGFLKKIKDAIKAFDGKRKELVDPLNSTVKKINAGFKPRIETLEVIQRQIEGKMGAWQLAEKQRKEKAIADARARELAEMEARKNDFAEGAAITGDESLLDRAAIIEEKQIEVAAQPIKAKVSAEFEGAKTSTRFEWAFEVTDPAAVSRAYCSPDEKKIKEAVKSGVREISGVRIYERAITITR